MCASGAKFAQASSALEADVFELPKNLEIVTKNTFVHVQAAQACAPLRVRAASCPPRRCVRQPERTLCLRNLLKTVTAEAILNNLPFLKQQANFVYCPINASRKVNLGYCFINFADGEDAAEFEMELHGAVVKPIAAPNKKLVVDVARVQGYTENVSKFRHPVKPFPENGKPLLLHNGKATVIDALLE